jgi:hypothetical protein
MNVRTGMKIGDDGSVQVMDADAWKQRKELLGKLGAVPEFSGPFTLYLP